MLTASIKLLEMMLLLALLLAGLLSHAVLFRGRPMFGMCVGVVGCTLFGSFLAASVLAARAAADSPPGEWLVLLQAAVVGFGAGGLPLPLVAAPALPLESAGSVLVCSEGYCSTPPPSSVPLFLLLVAAPCCAW